MIVEILSDRISFIPRAEADFSKDELVMTFWWLGYDGNGKPAQVDLDYLGVGSACVLNPGFTHH